MSQPAISAKDLGTWKLICFQLHRFQCLYAKERAERQAAPSLHRVEFAVRSYEAQRLASEED